MIVPINFLLHISFPSIRCNVLVAKWAVNIFFVSEFKESDNTFEFVRHVSTETSVIFS